MYGTSKIKIFHHGSHVKIVSHNPLTVTLQI